MYVAEHSGTTNYFKERLLELGVQVSSDFDVSVCFDGTLYFFYVGEDIELLRVSSDARYGEGYHLCGTIDVEENDLDTVAGWVRMKIREISAQLDRAKQSLTVA